MPAPDQFDTTIAPFLSRRDDAQALAQEQAEEARVAAERGMWALADLYVPPDIREAAQRWKLEHFLVEMWRSAFIQGWRQSQIAERRAGVVPSKSGGA